MAAPFEGQNPILGPQIFFKFHVSLIFTLLQRFMCIALKVKKFEFWRTWLGENPPLWNTQFLLGLGFFSFYPFLKFDPSSSKGLKFQNFGAPD